MNFIATTSNVPRALVGILAAAVVFSASVAGQTPEEHASHHPPTDPNGPVAAQSVGSDLPDAGVAGRVGVMGTPPRGPMAPQAGGQARPGAAVPGGMEMMGEMMRQMGVPPRKELYPALMELEDATFKICQDIVTAGGTIANIGVHGTKVDLHLERLWSHNVTITTRLVDTASIPLLLKAMQSQRLNAKQLITHHYKLDQILKAYETFSKAADTKALKVIIET